MSRILERIERHARSQPAQLALIDDRYRINYGELPAAIRWASSQLPAQRVAVLIENSCAWALTDLAVANNESACIPIPSFFSEAQIRHLIGNARPDMIVTDQPGRIEGLLNRAPVDKIMLANTPLWLFLIPQDSSSTLPPHTAKVTYTSGTTGHPKGACLSDLAITRVSIALSAAVGARPRDRSLSLLPQTTLLENIGGLYAPLHSGATAVLPCPASCGLDGSSSVQPQKLFETLQRYRPTTLIVVPQLLKLMVETVARGAALPDSLRFIAVGGAPCSPALIIRARDLGIPVHEGYGLSEAASVVSLNLPGEDKPGSVGRPLPHVRVRIADDGEVMVAGELFDGYLGADRVDSEEWPTGDLGRIDAEGYLYITGRKKTAYATAFGRKISPEWIESELTAHPAIVQAAVFGEAQPFNVAVLVPHPLSTPDQARQAIVDANARLPDYARVLHWHLADSPFSAQNGLASAGGGVDRPAIANHYAQTLEALYTGENDHVAL